MRVSPSRVWTTHGRFANKDFEMKWLVTTDYIAVYFRELFEEYIVVGES